MLGYTARSYLKRKGKRRGSLPETPSEVAEETSTVVFPKTNRHNRSEVDRGPEPELGRPLGVHAALAMGSSLILSIKSGSSQWLVTLT